MPTSTIPTLKAWNATSIAALPYAKDVSAYTYKDPSPHSHLSLRVGGRKKTWIWQARVKGMPRMIRLGDFPSVGLADARAKAGEINAAHDEGVDVYAVYGAGKSAPPPVNEALVLPVVTKECETCQEAWTRYIHALKTGTNVHSMRKAGNAPRTIIEKEGTWRRRFEAEIGDMPILDVTEDHIYDIVQVQRDEDTFGAANSSIRYIKAFFAWCVADRRKTGLRINPAQLLRPSLVASRTRYLSEDEIRWLWSALTAVDEEGRFRIPESLQDAYRLALLTGQRRQEIFGLSRDEVDDHRQHLAIPADRMKARRAHIVPVGPVAWKIIQRRLSATNSPLVFPSFRDGETDRPLSGFSKTQTRLRGLVQVEAAKARRNVEPWTFHDIRRTFASQANAIRDKDGGRRIAKDHIERVMSHTIGGVEGTYDRYDYYTEKRRALKLWEDELRRIVGEKNIRF